MNVELAVEHKKNTFKIIDQTSKPNDSDSEKNL